MIDTAGKIMEERMAAWKIFIVDIAYYA